MLRIYPVGQLSSVAARVPIPEGQALSRLEWYHNEAQAIFPLVAVAVGQPGQPPDLTGSGLTREDIIGSSLQWSSLQLEFPVTSHTGWVDVAFIYPEYDELVAKGTGGGPGLGLVPEGGVEEFYVSASSSAWVRFDDVLQLALRPVFVDAGEGSQPLGMMRSALSEGLLAAAQDEPPVRETALHLAAPNPFNPRTVIRFDLVQSGPVRLVVYNVQGRRVKTLVDGPRISGRHSLVWEGIDNRGSAVASGVYLLKMEAEGQSFRQKITLLR